MILVSMLPNEIYEIISKDYRKLEFRIEKYLPKAINIFKKARTFPIWYIDDYVIPETRNEHITFYYASNPSEITKPQYVIFSITHSDEQRYVIKSFEMAYKPTPDSKQIMIPQVHSYTSHFLQRYNERFLHKKNIYKFFYSANKYIKFIFFIVLSCIFYNYRRPILRMITYIYSDIYF